MQPDSHRVKHFTLDHMIKEIYAHFTDLLLEYRCHRLKFFPCDSDKNKQLRNISNTSKAGFNGLKNTENGMKNEAKPSFFVFVFLTNFGVFGNGTKHHFECLIYLLKSFI